MTEHGELWHTDPTALQDYARGRGSEATAWSIETHLPVCAACRDVLDRLLTTADRSLLDATREALDLPPQQRRRGSRAVVVEGVLGPWWAWIGLVAAILVILTLVGHAPIGPGPAQAGLSWALLLAPVFPVAMVAACYTLVDVDAAAGVTPRGGTELALIRTAAVLTITVAAVFAGLRMTDVVEVAWLLPGLALSLGAVALGPWAGVERAAVALTGLWGLLVVAATVPATSLTSPLAPLLTATGAGAQAWAVVIVAALAALLLPVLNARRTR